MRTLRRGLTALMLILPLLLPAGCAGGEGPAQELPQLSVYCDLDGAGPWLGALQARFPGVRLEIEFIGTNDNSAELARRIQNGDAADIILSGHLRREMPGLSQSLADLSAKSYVNQYLLPFLSEVNLDGRLYFLPVQISLVGPVYQHALFAERGWQAPGGFEELLARCRVLQEEGLCPALFASGPDGVTQIFSRLLMLNVGSTMEGASWLERYRRGAAEVSDIDLSAVFDDFDALAQAGAIRPGDRDILNYSHTIRQELTQRRLGFAENVVSFTREASLEVRMFPCYSSLNSKGSLFLIPQICVAAGARTQHSPEKAALIDGIFAYLSSEEGQWELMGLTRSVYSPTLGLLPAAESDLLADVQDALREERFLLQPHLFGTTVLSEALEQYLLGEIPRGDVLAACDRDYALARGRASPVLAVAQGDLSVAETCGVVCAAMARCLDAGVALVRSADGSAYRTDCVAGRLYAGDVTKRDLNCIAPFRPDAKTPPTLDRVVMTGAQLLAVLGEGSPYHYTGLRLEYVWNGQRYEPGSLRDLEGNAIGPDELVDVALLSADPLEAAVSRKTTGLTLDAALDAYLRGQPPLAPGAIAVDLETLSGSGPGEAH